MATPVDSFEFDLLCFVMEVGDLDALKRGSSFAWNSIYDCCMFLMDRYSKLTSFFSSIEFYFDLRDFFPETKLDFLPETPLLLICRSYS